MQYRIPSGQYLAQDGHCVFAETSHSSKSSTLPWLWMFFLVSSLNVLSTSVFCGSVINDSVLAWSSESLRQPLDSGRASRSSSTALCGTPCTRKSTSNGFSCPAIDSSTLVCRCNSSSCWTCQASLHKFGRRSKCRNPLIQNLITFGAYHFLNATCWHWVVKDSGFCVPFVFSIKTWYSSGSLPMGSKAVKKTVYRSSLVCFPPATSTCLHDGVHRPINLQ